MTEINWNTFSRDLGDEQVVGVAIADAHDPTDQRRGSVAYEEIVSQIEKSFRRATHALEGGFQVLRAFQIAVDKGSEF